MMATILEAALRSLVAAAAVGAGLHVLRVRNVLAQKVVWGMVLAAALAMPILLPAAARWPVARLVVHADPMTLLEELQARIRARGAVQPAVRPAAAPAPQTLAGPVEVQPAPKRHAAKPKAEPRETVLDEPAGQADLHAASVILVPETAAPPTPAVAPVAPAAHAVPVTRAPRGHMPSPATLAVLAYAVIALALLGRLLVGLVAALALRHRATRIVVDDPTLAEPLDLRVSAKVASPVTIGSTVVLPTDYVEWDAEKLRIVLAHEGSHIRQGDFYLQLAAGAHASLFWFSPLGWWLRRKLSDLAEAISDRAGLAQAPSRSAYAKVLLEFAARPRPTQLGVAMARQGKLTRRIERLLNESTFSQAYAGTRRRALIAVLLVPAALFVSTAAVRVDAAQEPAPPAAPKAPAAMPAPTAAPLAAPTPEPREGMAAPEPDVNITVPDPMPAPQAMPAPPAPPDQMVILDNDDEPSIVLDSYTPLHGDRMFARANRMVMRKDDNGDSYVIVHGNGQISVDGKAENDALQKARKMAKGDFVLYTHAGKSYIIDDPATVAQIESAMGPMHLMAFKAKMLSDQNAHLAEMQKRFAERDKEFAEKQKTIILRQKEWQEKQQSLTAPELKKQMQELNETVAKLETRKDEKLTNEDLAKLRSEVAELQAKLSGFPMHFEFQKIEIPKIDIPKIEIDKQMAEAQRHVVEAQKHMQQESDQKMKSIIDQSMKDGKAKPIQ